MTYKVGLNLENGIGTPRAISGVATGVSGIMVNAVKGPLNLATLVTTLKEYERIFGDVSPIGSTSYEQVAAFFADATSAQLYVVRVAHSTAAKATKTFVDRLGSPANTLRIDAKSEGA
jgi:phage tail sheath gpL-like